MANKTKVIHVAVEPETHRQLVKLAGQMHCPASQIIRNAIRQLVVAALEPRQQERSKP